MRYALYMMNYLLQAGKLLLGYELIFGEKIEHKWLYSVGMVPYLGLLLMNVDGSIDSLVLPMYFLLYVITAFSIKGTFFNGLQKLLILEVFLTVYDSIVVIPFDLFDLDLENDVVSYVLLGIVKLVLLAGVYAVMHFSRAKANRKGPKDQQIRIRRTLPAWAALLLNVILIATTGLYTYRLSESGSSYYMITLIVFASNIGILELIRMITYTVRMNERLNDQFELEKSMSEMKTDYYEMMLKKEEDTRRYRHDMMNHYICLKQLNEDGNSKAIGEYLGDLMGNLEAIRKENVVVGNHTIEILLNYYLGQLPDNIEKTVLGMAPESLSMSDTDICTMFGNILSNATEELKKHGSRPGYLRVEFKEGRMFFCICVKNSVIEKKLIDKDKFVATTKSDRSNHGFGLRNTRDIVERAGGNIEIECDDTAFSVTIYLKLSESSGPLLTATETVAPTSVAAASLTTGDKH